MHTINIDGASRGNPGPASCAFVVRDDKGKIVRMHGHVLGHTTNNVAEYSALILALNYASDNDLWNVTVLCDSLLVVNQTLGAWKVKDLNLAEMNRTARRIIQRIPIFLIKHIPRELNGDADKLCNCLLDEAK